MLELQIDFDAPADGLGGSNLLPDKLVESNLHPGKLKASVGARHHHMHKSIVGSPIEAHCTYHILEVFATSSRDIWLPGFLSTLNLPTSNSLRNIPSSPTSLLYSKTGSSAYAILAASTRILAVIPKTLYGSSADEAPLLALLGM